MTFDKNDKTISNKYSGVGFLAIMTFSDNNSFTFFPVVEPIATTLTLENISQYWNIVSTQLGLKNTTKFGLSFLIRAGVMKKINHIHCELKKLEMENQWM